jgi:hypothetical protein
MLNNATLEDAHKEVYNEIRAPLWQFSNHQVFDRVPWIHHVGNLCFIVGLKVFFQPHSPSMQFNSNHYPLNNLNKFGWVFGMLNNPWQKFHCVGPWFCVQPFCEHLAQIGLEIMTYHGTHKLIPNSPWGYSHLYICLTTNQFAWTASTMNPWNYRLIISCLANISFNKV